MIDLDSMFDYGPGPYDTPRAIVHMITETGPHTMQGTYAGVQPGGAQKFDHVKYLCGPHDQYGQHITLGWHPLREDCVPEQHNHWPRDQYSEEHKDDRAS